MVPGGVHDKLLTLTGFEMNGNGTSEVDRAHRDGIFRSTENAIGQILPLCCAQFL